MTRPNRRGIRGIAAAVVAAAALVLAGCSNDSLAAQYRAGDNKGFISGDFQVQEIPADQRGAAVTFSGTTDQGTDVTSSQYLGKVVVVNFWYAACGPCRAEAPVLEKAFTDVKGQDVEFLGVNIYDQAETSRSFAQTYGVSYPSVIAINNGDIKMSFAKYVPLSAVPVTVVLDKQGRVSSRIVSQLSDASILTSLITTAGQTS